MGKVILITLLTGNKGEPSTRTGRKNAPQDCDCSKPQQTQPIAETSHLRKCCQAALYTVLGSGCQAGLAGPWENAFAWP